MNEWQFNDRFDFRRYHRESVKASEILSPLHKGAAIWFMWDFNRRWIFNWQITAELLPADDKSCHNYYGRLLA